MRYNIFSLQQLDEFAREIKQDVTEYPKVLFLLKGTLGSGKTTFVQHFAKTLGVNEETQSPTYTLLREYNIFPPQEKLYHLDLYRIEEMEQLESNGIWDVLTLPRGVFCIEWPELLEEVNFNAPTYIIEFLLEDDERYVIVSKQHD